MTPSCNLGKQKGLLRTFDSSGIGQGPLLKVWCQETSITQIKKANMSTMSMCTGNMDWKNTMLA